MQREDIEMVIAFAKDTVIQVIASYPTVGYYEDAQKAAKFFKYETWAVIPTINDEGDLLPVQCGDRIVGNAFCRPNGEIIVTVPKLTKQCKVAI